MPDKVPDRWMDGQTDKAATIYASPLQEHNKQSKTKDNFDLKTFIGTNERKKQETNWCTD